jgi:hypothetical protein
VYAVYDWFVKNRAADSRRSSPRVWGRSSRRPCPCRTAAPRDRRAAGRGRQPRSRRTAALATDCASSRRPLTANGGGPVLSSRRPTTASCGGPSRIRVAGDGRVVPAVKPSSGMVVSPEALSAGPRSAARRSSSAGGFRGTGAVRARSGRRSARADEPGSCSGPHPAQAPRGRRTPARFIKLWENLAEKHSARPTIAAGSSSTGRSSTS